MSNVQKSYCDALVYVPQYGTGTASLNVNVATGIVLHHFAYWSKIKEVDKNGQKFIVGEKPLRINSKGNIIEIIIYNDDVIIGVVRDMTPEEVRRDREERRIKNDDLPIFYKFEDEKLSDYLDLI